MKTFSQVLAPGQEGDIRQKYTIYTPNITTVIIN